MIKKDLEKVKFYIGPMSKNIVDTIVDFSIKEDYKIGLIPSRRQIDWNSGYVNRWTTDKFIAYLSNRKNLILERDHGGFGQVDIDKKKENNHIVSFFCDAQGVKGFAEKYTIDKKLLKRFDIIHIDPWCSQKNFQKGLNETVKNIKYINNLNDDCLFEIGTEESIYHFDEIMLEKMLFYLKNNLGRIFDKIVYCVIQSGTKLEGTKNTGHFDLDRLKKMIEVCNKYEVLSKEHNGDYLTLKDFKIRFDAGLSAINIAPEFGVFETDVLLEHMTEEQQDTFFRICYKSNKWIKWVSNDFEPFENKTELMRICGHYQFSTPEFLDMNINIDNIIREKLYNKIKEITNYEKNIIH